MEFELRIAHVDVVRRWIGDRTVDAEDGKLDLLAGLDVAPNDQPVLGVPTFDDRATALSRGPRQLAVHPDLGIVVERRRKNYCRAGRSEIADSLWNRDLDAVPVESEFPRGTAFIQSRGIYDFPFRVVEIGSARMRRKVIGLVGGAGGLAVGSSGFEIDLDDLRVAVAPFASNKLRACFGGKVDGCLGLALGERFVERCARDKVGGQREEEGDG